VELPEVGTELEKGDEAAVVESVKAASEVYSPVTGEVIDVNGELESEPSKVNADATDSGWFFKIKLADKTELDDLMDEATYLAFVEGLE
jgi:glycine cleavage system H protein